MEKKVYNSRELINAIYNLQLLYKTIELEEYREELKQELSSPSQTETGELIFFSTADVAKNNVLRERISELDEFVNGEDFVINQERYYESLEELYLNDFQIVPDEFQISDEDRKEYDPPSRELSNSKKYSVGDLLRLIIGNKLLASDFSRFNIYEKNDKIETAKQFQIELDLEIENNVELKIWSSILQNAPYIILSDGLGVFNTYYLLFDIKSVIEENVLSQLEKARNIKTLMGEDVSKKKFERFILLECEFRTKRSIEIGIRPIKISLNDLNSVDLDLDSLYESLFYTLGRMNTNDIQEYRDKIKLFIEYSWSNQFEKHLKTLITKGDYNALLAEQEEEESLNKVRTIALLMEFIDFDQLIIDFHLDGRQGLYNFLAKTIGSSSSTIVAILQEKGKYKNQLTLAKKKLLERRSKSKE